MRHGITRIGRVFARALREAPLRWVLILCAVLAFIPACGGDGGTPEAPLTHDRFGAHVLPVEMYQVESPAIKSIDPHGWFPLARAYGISLDPAQQIEFRYLGEDDFRRMNAMGAWAVTNFFKWWVDRDDTRPHVFDLIDYCDAFGIKLIGRIEDTTRYSNYADPGPTDERWFREDWTPYVERMAAQGKGKVYAWQIWNEAWEPSRWMVGPTGQQITEAEYVTFLRDTRAIIKAIDPDVLVLNSGITSITETYFNGVTKRLIAAGMLEYTDLFNFHYYADDIDSDDERAIHGIASRTGDKPWIVTEANHINPNATDAAKWNMIQQIWDACGSYGKTPVALLGFVWRSDDFLPAGWTMERRLENMILADAAWAVRPSTVLGICDEPPLQNGASVK
ncbi:MAG: hypothetical protein HY788_06830 [Deltaproteobacteria bacterium]|nr:hypothetical protein [Deltaproteobacteria bacterium]